ncbi:MAG: PAAR domain-containing protein [Lysobacter sp.]|nr:PAAR domain-containing protein [Lysobacter sp.]
MPLAARIADLTSHPGAIAPGPSVPARVFIEKMMAARVGDMHVCAFPPPAGPHPPNKIESGSVTVFLSGMPAARIGDPCSCSALISSSALTVSIGP